MRFRYSYRKKAKLFANSGDPDQTPQNAASDLGLHCLPISRLGVSRLQRVKKASYISFHGEIRKKYHFFWLKKCAGYIGNVIMCELKKEAGKPLCP